MTSLYKTCDDDRFELIAKAKAKLLEATNIEMRPDEMAVIDSILFRCWQMGWLDQLRENCYSELFGMPDSAAMTSATDNRTTELLPCPFCGGEAETVGDDYMEWIAECVKCCASSMTLATEAEAIAAWNTRSDYAVQAENERKAEQAIAATLGSDALRLACQHVAEDTGSCPYDVHHLECASWEDDCDGRCSANVDMAACWQRYFNAKVVSA